MPPPQEPNSAQQSNENLSAFQKYLLQDKQLVDQYQQVINGFVADCKTHNPTMSAETETALGSYFVSYIVRGADPARIAFKELSQCTPEELHIFAEGIPDKLTEESRERFAHLGRERSDAARWDQLFLEGNDLVIPLETEAKSLRERIDDVIAAHNAKADSQYQIALEKVAQARGITVENLQEILSGDPKTMSPQDRSLLSIGKDQSQVRVRIQPGVKLREYTGQTNKWEPSSKFSDVLQQDEHKILSDAIAIPNAEIENRYNDTLKQVSKEYGMTLAELQEKIPKIMRGDEKKMLPEDIKLRNTLRAAKEGKLCIWTEEQLQEYNRRKGTWEPGRKLGGFLSNHADLAKEYDGLATNTESFQGAMQAPPKASKTPVPYGAIGTQIDGYNPDSMHVVISRDPQRIGESSSGQTWFSCMSERGVNFRYLDADIEQGTLVAYLAAKDDPLVRRPLARILLKPYTNADTGETILVPGKAYGGVDDYTQGRRETLSPRIKASFQEAVLGWVRESTHQGKNGTFQIRTGLYGDGELTIQTIKDKWSNEDVSEGLKGFRQGLIQEFLTEHYNLQSDVDRMPAGAEKIARQTQVNAEYIQKWAQFEDPGAMAKTYLKQLKKSSLGAVPTLGQATGAAKEIDSSRKTALESLATTDPNLVMKCSIYEVRLGNPVDETLITRAIQKMPHLAFNADYRDVVIGKSWSEQLVISAAKADPETTLVRDGGYSYSDQPWAGKVLEMGARSIDSDGALTYAHRYKTEPYAKEVITAAALAKPNEALENFYKYSDQEWAGGILEAAAKKASPQTALKHLKHFQNKPYAKEVLVAAAQLDPYHYIDNADSLANIPCVKEVLMVTAELAPDKFLEKVSSYSRQDPFRDADDSSYFTKDVVEVAARHATPEVLLGHLHYLKNEPYAKELFTAAAKLDPDGFLAKGSAYHRQPWGEDVLELAARHASAETVLMYAHVFEKKPYAKEVLSAAAQLAHEYVLQRELVYSNGDYVKSQLPWASDLAEIAVNAAMEKRAVTPDKLINVAAKYADQGWARDAITKLHQNVESATHAWCNLTIVQNADRLAGHAWADDIITDIINKDARLILSEVDRLRGGTNLIPISARKIIARAIEIAPDGLQYLPKFIDMPGVEDILRATLQTHPDAVLKNAAHFGDKPYTPLIIKDALNRAAEVSPRSVLEFSGIDKNNPWAKLEFGWLDPNEPWVKTAVKQAVMKLSSASDDERMVAFGGDYTSRGLLLKHADKFADEDYGKDVVIAEAKKSPIDALANSEKFSHHPWAEDVLSDAAKSVRREPYGVLSNADLIKGKEFVVKGLTGSRRVTGNELIERAAGYDARLAGHAVQNADKFIDIPNAEVIVCKALKRAPEGVLENWGSSTPKWHDAPWADAAREAAYRASIKTNPEGVFKSLQDSSTQKKSWCGALIEESYRAIARKDPAKALNLVQDSFDRPNVPPEIAQDAYRRLQARNPEAARQYADLQILSETTNGESGRTGTSPESATRRPGGGRGPIGMSPDGDEIPEPHNVGGGVDTRTPAKANYALPEAQSGEQQRIQAASSQSINLPQLKLNITDPTLSLTYGFDTFSNTMSNHPLARVTDGKNNFFIKTVSPSQMEAHLKAQVALGPDAIIQYANAREISVDSLPAELQAHYQNLEGRKLLLIDKVPYSPNLIYDLIGQGEDGSVQKAIQQRLGGKAVTSAEQQQMLNELRTLSEAGIIHGDLPANMSFLRDVNGKLRLYVIDPWPEKAAGNIHLDTQDFASILSDMQRTGAAEVNTLARSHPKFINPSKIPLLSQAINPEESIYKYAAISLEELKQRARDSGAGAIPKDQVPLKLERLAYHEVIVQLITTKRIETKAELVSQVETIMATEAYKHLLVSDLSPESIRTGVTNAVREASAINPLPDLSMHPANERNAILMVGGTATGKSTTLQATIMDMVAKGQDVGAVVNADNIKILLYEPTMSEEMRGQLTSKESALIADKAVARLNEMAANGKAPNIALENSMVSLQKIEVLRACGVTPEVIYTFCPPDEALERAGWRGPAEGRHVPQQTVLQTAKSTVRQLPELVADKDLRLSIFNTDVVVPGEAIKLIAFKAPGSSTLEVYDGKSFVALMQENAINIKAETPDAIYKTGQTPEKIFSKTIQEYTNKGITIAFINPDTQSTIATLTGNNLVIADETAFDASLGNRDTPKNLQHQLKDHGFKVKLLSQGEHHERAPKSQPTSPVHTGLDTQSVGEDSSRGSPGSRASEKNADLSTARQGRQSGTTQPNEVAGTGFVGSADNALLDMVHPLQNNSITSIHLQAAPRLSKLNEKLLPYDKIIASVRRQNLLGQGGGHSVFQVDDHPGKVIKIPTKYLTEDLELKAEWRTAREGTTVDSALRKENFGQVVQSFGDDITLNYRQYGKPARPHEALYPTQAEQFAHYESMTRQAAEMPIEAYVELLLKARKAEQAGYVVDPKADNLLIDGQGKHFNLVDMMHVSETSSRDIGPLALQCMIMDSSYHTREYRGANEDQMLIWQDMIEQKMIAATKDPRVGIENYQGVNIPLPPYLQRVDINERTSPDLAAIDPILAHQNAAKTLIKALELHNVPQGMALLYEGKILELSTNPKDPNHQENMRIIAANEHLGSPLEVVREGNLVRLSFKSADSPETSQAARSVLVQQLIEAAPGAKVAGAVRDASAGAIVVHSHFEGTQSFFDHVKMHLGNQTIDTLPALTPDQQSANPQCHQYLNLAKQVNEATKTGNTEQATQLRVRMSDIEAGAKKQYSTHMNEFHQKFNEHVSNTKGSMLLNLNQTIQGIASLQQLFSNPEFNKPEHNTEKWIKTGIVGSNMAMGAGGAAVDGLTMYKPTSMLGGKFGGITSVIGAGISAYDLGENIYKASISKTPLTWEKEGRAIAMSGTNLTTSSVGAVGSVMAWRGASGSAIAAMGGKLVTMSAYSGGALGLGQITASVIEGYTSYEVARAEMVENLQSRNVASVNEVGKAKTTLSDVDIPGLKPKATGFNALSLWLSEMDAQKPKYSGGSPIDFKQLLDRPKELQRITAALSTANRGNAESIRKAEFDGFLTRETINDTLTAQYIFQPLETMVSGRNIGKEIEASANAMDKSTRLAALGSNALTEIAGDMGNGGRNYQQRYADYERLIKPLEEKYSSQIQELEKLREIKIIPHLSESIAERHIERLGAKPDSPEMKQFNQAMARADQEDAVRYKQASDLATYPNKNDSMAKIQKFLGVGDKEWKESGSNEKNVETIVREKIKEGSLLKLLKGHVQATSARNQAIPEQLGKITFAQEMEKVEKMSPEQREEYFAKNRDFVKNAELQDRKDLALVGLSTSTMDYMAKKIEFTPQSLEQQAIQDGITNHKQFKALKQQNAKMSQEISTAETLFKALTGKEMDPARLPAKDGEHITNDKQQPLTIAERQQQLAGVIQWQQEEINAFRDRKTTNKDPDLAAKMNIKRATLSALQLQTEALNQQEMGYKFAQYENAKKEYRAGTAEMFATAENTPLNVQQQDACNKLSQKAIIHAKTFTDLVAQYKAGQAIEMSALQNAEMAMLQSHRALAELLADATEQQRSKLQESAVTRNNGKTEDAPTVQLKEKKSISNKLPNGAGIKAQEGEQAAAGRNQKGDDERLIASLSDLERTNIKQQVIALSLNSYLPSTSVGAESKTPILPQQRGTQYLG